MQLSRRIAARLAAPALIIGGIGAAMIGSGGAASAAPPITSSSTTATVNVGYVETLTGLQPIALTGIPGSTVTGAAEVYNVTSNDAAGYVVSVGMAGPNLVGPGSAVLPNGVFSVSSASHPSYNTLGNALAGGNDAVASKSTASGTGGDSYTDSYEAIIPTTAVPGAYTGTLQYQLAGS